MNPSSKILFHLIILFTVLTSKAFCFSFFKHKISYSDHCNSYAPEAIPTSEISTRFPFLEPVTSHYTGGQNIFDQDPASQRSILFEATRNLFRTKVRDTYKIQARLSFFPSNIHHRVSNFSNIKSNYSRVGLKYHGTLVFNLDGFWSVSTNKLCMVGSARWFTKKGKPVKLDAVLKLKFARFINLKESLVSGVLESLASPNNYNHFDKISMLGFPRVDPFKYRYTMVSNEECNVAKIKKMQDSVTSMGSLDVCSIFSQRFITYKLEYPSNCKNCSLFGQDNGYMPTFVSLYAIQCSYEDKKLRFLVEFQDRRFTPYDQAFQPDISLIGEGTWKGTKDELCITACRILNQSDPLGSASVGDCSIRLTLWFPAVRSLMKTHTTEGQIWSTKFRDGLGSFRKATFQSFDHSRENYGLKYEYTQMEKVGQICPKKKHVGALYQFEYHGFDMLVRHENMSSSGSVVPIFVGSQGFNGHKFVNPWQVAVSPASDISTTSGPVNISFEISFRQDISTLSSGGISSLNLSSTDDDKVDISAEGVYDIETGQICMVACRSLIENSSFDCEIMVKFQLSQANGKRSLITGDIESLREENDILYFEKLDIVSLSVSASEARELISRMDLQMIMVLISDTLMCVFIGRQIIHLKKRSEIVNSISVVMMLILTLGHMFPLVLSFEAIFSHTTNKQNVPIWINNGSLEVIVRIVTMVAFILQLRLLQLTWMAKKNHWIHEILTLVICLSIFIISWFTMLLANWKKSHDTTIILLTLQTSENPGWIYLKSYAGLTLDGFLLPQLILNILKISKGNALSHWFYMGTTFVRLLPHAFDLYWGEKYFSRQFDLLSSYGSHRAVFYSPSWDIVVICGGLVFAVVVFLQQHFGGRFMFPKRFQEHAEYDIVPVTSNET